MSTRAEKEMPVVKEEPVVKYDQLISKAEREGRINGPHRCIVCGMRYLDKEGAEECCRAVLEAGEL